MMVSTLFKSALLRKGQAWMGVIEHVQYYPLMQNYIYTLPARSNEYSASHPLSGSAAEKSVKTADTTRVKKSRVQ